MKDNSETCPHCGHDTDFDVKELVKGQLVCSHCGERIYACSVCAKLNGTPQCDWSWKTNKCSFALADTEEELK